MSVVRTVGHHGRGVRRRAAAPMAITAGTTSRSVATAEPTTQRASSAGCVRSASTSTPHSP
jgi:hypothetical protein